MSKSKPKPRVDLDRTRERLEHLGLVHAAERLAELLEQAVKRDGGPHRFLDDLLESESVFREERRIRTSLRLSGLPTGQSLGNFDFSFQPAIEKNRIETLATCNWIREHETTLFLGPPDLATYCSTFLRR